MENESKKVPFVWRLGEETVSLHVSSYAYGNRLYIGMTSYEADGAEPFADMTVNIPEYPLAPNEAIISGDISKDLLKFIKENKLGVKLPCEVVSGYSRYAVVAFDLNKLKEFDEKGVTEYMKLHKIPEKVTAKKKQKNKEVER